MINHFTFNGTSTAQLGLIVSGVSIFGAGSRKVEKAGIPGRNGDLQIELGGFNNYTVRYTVSITKNFTTTAQQIREWLLEAKGYCDLTDTYHPDEIRKACFNSDIEFTTSMLYKYGQASIQFDCLPERYLTTNTPITTTATADTTTDTTMSLSTVPTPINISLNGNTTQEGSSGKNLLGVYSGAWTKNGVSYTVDNDGLVTTSGTASASGGRLDYKSDAITLRAGTYTFKQIVISGSSNVGALLTNIDSTSTTYGASTTGNTFTLSARVTVRLGFNVTSGTAYNSKFYLQLEKGSTATSYEPHISPTNPQVIHNVSGDNEISVTGKNILTPFIIGISINSNNGNEVPSVLGATTDYIPVDYGVNPNYYLSGISSTIHSFVCAYNSNKQFLGRTPSTFRNDITLPKTAYTSGTAQGTGDISYLRVTYYQQGTDTDVSTANNYLTQLEVGSTATPYEPYTRQSYPLYLPVENLMGFVVSDFTGAYGSANYVEITGLKEGDYYTCSSNAPTGYIWFGTNANASQGTINFNRVYEGNSVTVQVNSMKKITIGILASDKATALSYNTQIEKGTKANHYTPYGTTPIELNKIGTYQDYIYKNGGKWYVHKALFKYIENGQNNVVVASTSYIKSDALDFFVTPSGMARPTYAGDLLASSRCNKLTAPSSGIPIWNTVGYPNMFTINSNQLHMNIANSIVGITNPSSETQATAQTKAVTYLQTQYNNGTPLEFILPLATPTNTEITDTTLINQLNNIEKAYSYDGGTNILQVSNDNGFMLEVVSLHGSTFNSNYKGEPIITVNSTGLIYLNGEVMEVLSAPVTINCQTMQCYNGVVNMNNEVRVNDFPEIKIGENTVGSSMALTITPNNWRH